MFGVDPGEDEAISSWRRRGEGWYAGLGISGVRSSDTSGYTVLGWKEVIGVATIGWVIVDAVSAKRTSLLHHMVFTPWVGREKEHGWSVGRMNERGRRINTISPPERSGVTA